MQFALEQKLEAAELKKQLTDEEGTLVATIKCRLYTDVQLPVECGLCNAYNFCQNLFNRIVARTVETVPVSVSLSSQCHVDDKREVWKQLGIP